MKEENGAVLLDLEEAYARIAAAEARIDSTTAELVHFGTNIVNEFSAIKAVLELWDSKQAEMGLKLARELRDIRSAIQETRVAVQDTSARVRRLDGERAVTLADVDAVRKSWNDMAVLMATLDERQKQTEDDVDQIRSDVGDTKQRDLMTAERAAEVLAAENRRLIADAAGRNSIADVELKKTEITLEHGAKEAASGWRRDIAKLVLVAFVTIAGSYVAARLGVSAQPAPTTPAPTTNTHH
jgi:chromosome segregation ATPase